MLISETSTVVLVVSPRYEPTSLQDERIKTRSIEVGSMRVCEVVEIKGWRVSSGFNHIPVIWLRFHLVHFRLVEESSDLDSFHTLLPPRHNQSYQR